MNRFCWIFFVSQDKKKGLEHIILHVFSAALFWLPFSVCVVFLCVPMSYVLVHFTKQCIKLQSRWKKTILGWPGNPDFGSAPSLPSL